MTDLARIEHLGYSQAFFHLKPEEDGSVAFTYYTFDVRWPREFLSYWDLIGLRRRSEKPFLCDVRLLYIDEEMFEWPDFEAVRDASGLISFNPQQFLDVITFFEKLVDVQPANLSLTHFRLMSAEALTSLHCPQFMIDEMVGCCYYYLPAKGLQEDESINMICFPRWSLQYGMHQRSSLSFATFSRHQLEDVQFDPFDGHGLGTVTFDRAALQEFVFLLKEHSYETFARRNSG
jgi:hypothetical protein